MSTVIWFQFKCKLFLPCLTHISATQLSHHTLTFYLVFSLPDIGKNVKRGCLFDAMNCEEWWWWTNWMASTGCKVQERKCLLHFLPAVHTCKFVWNRGQNVVVDKRVFLFMIHNIFTDFIVVRITNLFSV